MPKFKNIYAEQDGRDFSYVLPDGSEGALSIIPKDVVKSDHDMAGAHKARCMFTVVMAYEHPGFPVVWEDVD